MATTARQHAHATRTLAPVTAEPGERADVASLLQALDDLLRSRTRGPVRGEFVGMRGRHAPVPGSVVQVLERVTQAMARGDAVAVVSAPAGRLPALLLPSRPLSDHPVRTSPYLSFASARTGKVPTPLIFGG